MKLFGFHSGNSKILRILIQTENSRCQIQGNDNELLNDCQKDCDK